MQTTATSPTDVVRAALAERLSTFPLVSGGAVRLTRPWRLPELTDSQLRERALLEAAMRAGTLRGIPSVFGELA